MGVLCGFFFPFFNVYTCEMNSDLLLHFFCSSGGVSPKVFALFCYKTLKAHFESHEAPSCSPLTINIFKTELQDEMGITIQILDRCFIFSA